MKQTKEITTKTFVTGIEGYETIEIELDEGDPITLTVFDSDNEIVFMFTNFKEIYNFKLLITKMVENDILKSIGYL